MKKLVIIAVAVLASIVLGWSLWPKPEVPAMVVSRIIPPEPKGPDVQTVVAVSLKAVKAQNKIVPMEAHYVAVVTSDETRLGIFHSRNTLILPGVFRYVVDLSKVEQSDVRWDAANRSLRVKLPPVELDGPSIDMTKSKVYSDGVLTSFTSVDEGLQQRNREEARKQLVQQAGAENVMRMARNAAMRAVEQTFLLPMRAAGLDCTVEVSF